LLDLCRRNGLPVTFGSGYANKETLLIRLENDHVPLVDATASEDTAAGDDNAAGHDEVEDARYSQALVDAEETALLHVESELEGFMRLDNTVEDKEDNMEVAEEGDFYSELLFGSPS
jgi:hypothetical protein